MLRHVMLGLTATAVTVAIAGLDAGSAFQSTEERLILIRVVNQTRDPINGATVQLNYRTPFDFVNELFETDEAGIAIVRLPAEYSKVSFGAHASGYVPRIRRWHAAGEVVPDEYTFALEPSTQVGGRVQNERGEPIAGARVELKFSNLSSPVFDDPAWINMLLVTDKLAPTTDSDGRWTYRSAPSDGDVTVQIEHPDYLPMRWTNDLAKQSFTAAELRAGEAVITLSDGVHIAGSVRSEQGRAVANANLVMQLASETYERPVTAEGNSQGRFRFPAVEEGTYYAYCLAPGFAPQRLKVEAGKNAKPLEFKLSRGRVVTIRAVDLTETPLRAFVSLSAVDDENWTAAHAYPPKPSLPVQTDEAGLFEWNSAPLGKLSFSVGAPGFQSADVEIPADESPIEKTFRLEREAVLVGRVVDRRSGEPIDRFVVIPFDGRTRVFRDYGVLGHEGNFELPMSRFESWSPTFHLMIEHEGHRTFLTDESFSSKKLPKDLEIELELAEPVSGVIVDANGRPVADVSVSMSERSTGLIETPSMELGRVLSDENGRFRFVAPPGGFAISAFGRAGYLNKDFDASDFDLGKLTLQPWSKLSGRVIDRTGRPVSNRSVLTRSIGSGRSGGLRPSITDQDGRFQFEMVRAGSCNLWVTSGEQGGQRISKNVEVPEGEDVFVEFEVD